MTDEGHMPESDPIVNEAPEQEEPTIKTGPDEKSMTPDELEEYAKLAEKGLKFVGGHGEDISGLKEGVATTLIEVDQTKAIRALRAGWNVLPAFTQRTLAGINLPGKAMDMVNLNGAIPLVQGLIKTGMIELKEGSREELNSSQEFKAKIGVFALQALAVFIPELKPFLPAAKLLVPLFEKGNEGMLDIADRVVEARHEREKAVEEKREETHEEVAYTDPAVPHDGFANNNEHFGQESERKAA